MIIQVMIESGLGIRLWTHQSLYRYCLQNRQQSIFSKIPNINGLDIVSVNFNLIIVLIYCIKVKIFPIYLDKKGEMWDICMWNKICIAVIGIKRKS